MDKRPQPRYQIFVSSTFRDLKAERQAVLNAILEMHHFPAGMEIFPATNHTPWELIRRIIAESDYYVLIVGGRYGSTDADGIGYTEKEYDLAIDLKKPVLVFLHANPGKIPADNIELDATAREKLEQFRKKISHHHVGHWDGADDLKAKVVLGLLHQFNTFPADGWVRASGINNTELMSKLLNVQDKYSNLKREYDSLKSRTPDASENEMFAGGNDELQITFDYVGKNRLQQLVTCTWNEIFYAIAPQMLEPKTVFGITNYPNLLWEKMKQGRDAEEGRLIPSNVERPGKSKEAIEDIEPSPETILFQFMALGLVELTYPPREDETVYTWPPRPTERLPEWFLTQEGKRKYLRHVAYLREPQVKNNQ